MWLVKEVALRSRKVTRLQLIFEEGILVDKPDVVSI